MEHSMQRAADSIDLLANKTKGDGWLLADRPDIFHVV